MLMGYEARMHLRDVLRGKVCRRSKSRWPCIHAVVTGSNTGTSRFILAWNGIFDEGRSTFSIILQKASRHIVPLARPEHAPRRRDSQIDFRVSARQMAFRLETDVRDWSATKR